MGRGRRGAGAGPLRGLARRAAGGRGGADRAQGGPAPPLPRPQPPGCSRAAGGTPGAVRGGGNAPGRGPGAAQTSESGAKSAASSFAGCAGRGSCSVSGRPAPTRRLLPCPTRPQRR